MAFELNMYPITPIIKGTYPQGTVLGKICLHISFNDEKKRENQTRLLLGNVLLILQTMYTLFFYFRIIRYVQRYGQRLCAIGRYKRNCKTLKTTVCHAILVSCFPNLNIVIRNVITRSDNFAQYVAQFLFVDVCIDLFYIGLFLFTARDDVPSMEETPRRTLFYVSKPKYLEPRRPEGVFPILARIDGTNSTGSRSCKDKPPNIQIPLIRVTRNAHRVTLYHAAFEKKVWNKHYWLRGPTVKVPKLTQVSPWSEEDQNERETAKLENRKQSIGENVLPQQDTKSLRGLQRSPKNKSSSDNVLSLDYDAIEILRSGESAGQSCDLAKDEKKITTRAGMFNYLTKNDQRNSGGTLRQKETKNAFKTAKNKTKKTKKTIKK